jgi:1-acyl-sn-glycerol-3-phosphate acyltransferase
MKKQIYKWIFFRLMGWKIVGEIDEKILKCVFMVVPHTSWHDFYLGIFTRGITGVEINWLGKKELFGFPFGRYFRYMGGAPLDRKGSLNKVDAIAEVLKNKQIFRLAIAPEGTRKKVTELKTGFYYIAIKANVPIIPVAFDFGKKEVRFGKPFNPTGAIEEDMKILTRHFIDTKGKVPEYSFEVI